MDTKWLETFITAAKYENFHVVSEKLFIAQPTVSVHIKRLEEIVGAPLFARRGRNVHLTAAGRRFLPYAERIVQGVEEGMRDMALWKQGYRRRLSLAVSPIVAVTILPQVIRRFIRKHPDIEMSIQVAESRDIEARLLEGEADIGFSRKQPMERGLESGLWKEEPVGLIAPHDGADFESAPPLDAERLLAEQLIFTHNHPEYWDDLLLRIRRHVPRVRTMKVSQVHVTKRFIEEGMGVSFLPRSIVQREIMEGRVLEADGVPFSLPSARTYVLYRRETEEGTLFLRDLQTKYGFCRQ